MRSVNAREFNQSTSVVLREVLETGEPVVVTYHGKPRLKVLPVDGTLSKLDELVLAGRATVPKRSAPLPQAGHAFSIGVDELLRQVRDER
jgi:prevent-host-death family protein